MAILDAVPLERISEQSREVQIGRRILAVLLGVLYVVGWLAGKGSVALSYAIAAVKVGWQDARAERTGVGPAS